MKRSQNLEFDFTLPHEFSARRAREVALQREKEKTHIPSEPPQKQEEASPKKEPSQKISLKKKKLKFINEKPPLTSPPSMGGDKGDGVKKIIEALQAAKTKEELASIILDELTSFFERAALLLVTRTYIVGWRGAGSPEFSHNIANVSIPLVDESVFKYCIEKQNHYTGMWNHKHGDHLFYESLGVTRTDDITVIPVLIKKKVFALFYADNYKVNPHHITSSDTETPHLQKVAEAFAHNIYRIMSKK
ncbi:MAG: hypothetical protein HYW47_00420 [Deltaproteobacteria bacterium]|nr:hypothetical protein [Deltaproteobacteria bacterium]